MTLCSFDESGLTATDLAKARDPYVPVSALERVRGSPPRRSQGRSMERFSMDLNLFFLKTAELRDRAQRSSCGGVDGVPCRVEESSQPRGHRGTSRGSRKA